MLYSSYLPLGVPNWTVKNYQHRAASQGGGSRRAAGGVEKRATERVRGEGEEEARSAGTSGYVRNWAGAVLQTDPFDIFS
jgi:hypothetical protein